MKVLVIAASKHGSTDEIAASIGECLSERGHKLAVSTVEKVDSILSYDAVVVGSAVYAGHWLKPAMDLVTDNASALSSLPVWLFSSGPVGDPPRPATDPVDVGELMTLIGARGHRLFAGKIDKSKLGFAEKAIVAALRVPYGDYRDWTQIKQWALEIADELARLAPSPR
jgi:menaquinone-dependent protoporphyrinogen oxidase